MSLFLVVVRCAVIVSGLHGGLRGKTCKGKVKGTQNISFSHGARGNNDMDYRRSHSVCDKLARALTRVLGHHGVPVALLCRRVVPVGHGFDGAARHRIPTRARRR